MRSRISRRGLLKGSASLATLALQSSPAPAAQRSLPWPIQEGPGTPKLCLGTSPNADEATMRRIKQLGIDYVLMGGPRIPWTEDGLRRIMERFENNGLKVCNMMIAGFPNVIYGRPGRDEEIEKVKQSIRAAGKAGLPVIEYNFYAHRLVEGYYEEPGRGGAGMTAFDYDRVKDLPPLPDEGAHSAEELWKNLEYFLKAIVPVAEEAGVRLAVHPNDPPPAISRGSAQILSTVAGWKRLIEIVDSPANGITFDPGVTRELGEDPVEVCRYFASRDRINHAHYRNVITHKPYEKYVEVFPDEGQVDMFAVMQELVRNKYTRWIYPEHPRGMDWDRMRPDFRAYYPGGGGYTGEAYNVAYARAMLQAALAGCRAD